MELGNTGGVGGVEGESGNNIATLHMYEILKTM